MRNAPRTILITIGILIAAVVAGRLMKRSTPAPGTTARPTGEPYAAPSVRGEAPAPEAATTPREVAATNRPADSTTPFGHIAIPRDRISVAGTQLVPGEHYAVIKQDGDRLTLRVPVPDGHRDVEVPAAYFHSGGTRGAASPLPPPAPSTEAADEPEAEKPSPEEIIDAIRDRDAEADAYARLFELQQEIVKKAMAIEAEVEDEDERERLLGELANELDKALQELGLPSDMEEDQP